MLEIYKFCLWSGILLIVLTGKTCYIKDRQANNYWEVLLMGKEKETKKEEKKKPKEDKMKKEKKKY